MVRIIIYNQQVFHHVFLSNDFLPFQTIDNYFDIQSPCPTYPLVNFTYFSTIKIINCIIEKEEFLNYVSRALIEWNTKVFHDSTKTLFQN